jgi:hypothetical protein
MTFVSFSSAEDVLPMAQIHQAWLLSAAVAVTKPVDQLTESEKVALCWVNGGELNGSLARAGMRFTTARRVGFYNGPDGRVITVFGPKA